MKNNAAIFFVLIFVLFFSGCITTDSQINTPLANDETYIREVLMKIRCNATKEEVVRFINQPYRDEDLRILWSPPYRNSRTKVIAYFFSNKLYKITWDKIRGTMKFKRLYERNCLDN